MADIASLQERTRVAEAVLDRHVSWASHFETKSSLILGVVTGMLAALAGFAPARAQWTTAMVISGGGALLAIAGALAFLYLGNYPRTRGPVSLIFFGSIASLSAGEHRRQMENLTASEYFADLVAQGHTLSLILDTRYRMLGRAYQCLFVALPLWVVTIYLARFASGA